MRLIITSLVYSFAARPLFAFAFLKHVTITSNHYTNQPIASKTNGPDNTSLLNPLNLNNGTIPRPKSLSPTSAIEFLNCPQAFLFRYLYKLKHGASAAALKGTLCHKALERLYDLKPRERTINNLHNLFRQEWATKRKENPDILHELFHSSTDKEKSWGKEALRLLDNYYDIENPQLIKPALRERWIHAQLPIKPISSTRKIAPRKQHSDESFKITGIIDRLDVTPVHQKSTTEQTVATIIDYKTGPAPTWNEIHSEDKTALEARFLQLKIYALLLSENSRHRNYTRPIPVRYLRLIYLTNDKQRAQILEYDLGRGNEQRNKQLREVHETLSETWLMINSLVSKQDPTLFVGCNRPYCSCHTDRQKFVPGTVWEPHQRMKTNQDYRSQTRATVANRTLDRLQI